LQHDIDVQKNQMLILTASLSCILILIAVGVYFASLPNSQSTMGGMMDGDSVTNSWVISVILIGAAVVVAVGLVLYFVFSKKTMPPERSKAFNDQTATLPKKAKKDTDVLSQIETYNIKGRVATGYANLDKLLYGGIPPNFAVVLTSPPSVEEKSLIRSFIETGVKNDEVTFYVTIDPSFAKDLAEKFASNFYLFICNPQADAFLKKGSNVFILKGVENLTDINIALTQAFRKLDVAKKGPRRICLNILSDALLRHGSVVTRKWLSELIAALNSEGFTILAVINSQMHASEDINAILGLFEGEINIFERETEEELKRYLKIKRMGNQKYLRNEIHLTEE
jgi:KaiC/GvpD/RAD55 family RecA-like ATPase